MLLSKLDCNHCMEFSPVKELSYIISENQLYLCGYYDAWLKRYAETNIEPQICRDVKVETN